jgi:hypothetical protein
MSKEKLFSVFFISLISLISFSRDPTEKPPVNNYSKSISLNGPDWLIAVDSTNTGRNKEWFKFPPVAESRQTAVPWVIQDIFHNYHGVVWYWKEFDGLGNSHIRGRYLIRFHAVDYLADVWVNGKYAGGHEGSETPFEIDITELIKKVGKNLLVVRVLNPTYEPIDGIALKDTPSGAKQYPFTGNAAYNSGGIISDVELLVVPSVRITNMHLVPDWKTGNVRINATVLNTGPIVQSSSLTFRLTESKTETFIISDISRQEFKPGTSLLEFNINIPGHKLWSPEKPFLYRIEASVQTQESIDLSSVRFGFRDFRFENGYFRLNGKRIFLKGTNFSTHYPVGFTVPLYEDMLKADVINMKSMGFNFVRIPFGCPNDRILDIYDELGIMVQQEHFGCWQIGDYGGYKFPKPANNEELLVKRFENSLTEVILRDRNHASVVMWGVLNENADNAIFRKAVAMLPSVRILDPSRLIVLNSGRFDKVKEIGSMSNPGSSIWDVREEELRDWHPYVWMPYSQSTLDMLSGISGSSGQKSYISETGLCFPIDLPSELGDYQLWGKAENDDALYYKRQYDKFIADWKKFNLSDCWARPDDYISDAYRTAASLRETVESAIRSNPYVVSYTPTNGVADAVAGESMATNFRRIKPEMVAPVLLSNEPVRWCLRTEPQSIYIGKSVNLMASFSNLDVITAGRYPATIRVFDPLKRIVFEKKMSVNIPQYSFDAEPPYAQLVMNEVIRIDGPEGKYLFTVVLDSGATAPGGKMEFYVNDKNDLPKLPEKVVVIGNDSIVEDWLGKHGVKIIPFDKKNRSERQLIIIVGNAPDSLTMISLACQMAAGSTAVFISPSVLKSGNNTTRWLPLVNKGSIQPMDAVAGYYRADRWAKSHPFFAGLPSGGMMDYTYFRNIISNEALSQEYTKVAKTMYTYDEVSSPLEYPAETICGATRISHTYCSGIHLGVWPFGEGKFVVNTLHIKENLGKDHAAERLFCNIINYSSPDLKKPMSPLPENFDQTLKVIGYK